MKAKALIRRTRAPYGCPTTLSNEGWDEGWDVEQDVKDETGFQVTRSGPSHLKTDVRIDAVATPWTPAVSVFYQLELALEMMAKEGLENIFARHRRIAQIVRDGVKALGLELFADERFASDTISAVKVPEGVDGKAFQKLCQDEYDLIIAGGQAKLAGKIFRIGHLGFVSEEDVKSALDVLAKALPRVGFAVPAGGS